MLVLSGNPLLSLVMLAVAGAAISITVTRAKIFEWLRDAIRGPIEVEDNMEIDATGVRGFFHDLVSCPYCFCHWTSLLTVAVFQPQWVHHPWWGVGFVADVFVLVGATAIMNGLVWESITVQSE